VVIVTLHVVYLFVVKLNTEEDLATERTIKYFRFCLKSWQNVSVSVEPSKNLWEEASAGASGLVTRTHKFLCNKQWDTHGDKQQP